MRHRKFRKEYKQTSLVIGGCGIITITICSLLLIDFSSQIDQRETLTYSELRSHIKMVDDINTYAFIDQILQTSHRVNEYDSLNLGAYTIDNSIDFKDFIRSLPDSIVTKDEKSYLKTQFSNQRLIWDKNKLGFVRVLAPGDINNIMQNEEDPWNDFQLAYGYNGIHDFSLPAFSRDKKLIIIEHYWQQGPFTGRGDIKLFELSDGQWNLIIEKNIVVY